MFFKKPNINFIIVGLGNPGKKYENTRHNVGFCAIEHLAKRCNVNINKSKFSSLCTQANIAGNKVLLLKPQTFMNLSGQSVQSAAAYYKVSPENIIVIYDDIALDVGKLRIRANGSAGGHNGIKSIIGYIKQDFPRVKIGVGEKPNEHYELSDWVLSTLTKAEKTAIAARYDDVCNACELIIKGELQNAQAKFN